jgi:hypothetical protein
MAQRWIAGWEKDVGWQKKMMFYNCHQFGLKSGA